MPVNAIIISMVAVPLAMILTRRNASESS